MRLLTLLCLLLTLSVSARAAGLPENTNHLRGINHVYMNIDTSMASDIRPAERIDLSDIMELQLRRGNIQLRTYVMNEPDVNIPLVELVIDTSSRIGASNFELILRVRDHVTIDRNTQKTVATTFEMRRRGTSSASKLEVDSVKMELRNLMADFVTALQRANPNR